MNNFNKKFFLFFIIYILIIGCGNNSKGINNSNFNYKYPNELNKTIVYEIDNGNKNGEGAFLKLKNNILAYVYTCFKESNNDDSYADICIIKSSDKDRKIWSQPVVLIKNHGKENIMSVSLLRKNDGSIFIQYLEKNSCNDLKIVRRYSFDELKTISKIHYLNVGKGYNVVNNDRILYYKNKIYTPISKHFCFNNEFMYSGIMELAITDENNNTSLILIPNKLDSNFTLQEPGIVNLKENNNLLMWFRNNTKNILIATSKDGGYHFSSIKYGILKVVPYSPSSIKRYNNDLFIVYNKWNENNLNNKRTPLVLAISKDDLNTIYKEYKLETNESLEFMYPSIYKDNNDLFIAYTIQNGNSFKLRIIKINNLFKK